MLHTINLQIDDSFYPHFKAILDSFVKDNKLKIINNKETSSEDIFVNSIEEVRHRVYLSEQEPSLSQNQYDKDMDDFFKKEFCFDGFSISK